MQMAGNKSSVYNPQATVSSAFQYREHSTRKLGYLQSIYFLRSNSKATMISAAHQFDSSTLFSGNTFMATQSTQALDLSFPPTKIRGPQCLFPLTVKQIAESCSLSDGKTSLVVYGVESNFRVLGLVMDRVERATDVSFLIDDGTGRIEIIKWLSVTSDSVEVASIEIGMYVEIIGHMKEFHGKKHAVAFSIRPVADYNKVPFHFIECIYVKLQICRMKGFAPPSNQMIPTSNAPFANGMNGYQAPFANQLNTLIQALSGMDQPPNDMFTTVLSLFQEPSTLTREHGLHIDEVLRRLNLPKNKIMDAVNYLVDVGLIYSTIDEYHFKSASDSY